MGIAGDGDSAGCIRIARPWTCRCGSCCVRETYRHRSVRISAVWDVCRRAGVRPLRAGERCRSASGSGADVKFEQSSWVQLNPRSDAQNPGFHVPPVVSWRSQQHPRDPSHVGDNQEIAPISPRASGESAVIQDVQVPPRTQSEARQRASDLRKRRSEALLVFHRCSTEEHKARQTRTNWAQPGTPTSAFLRKCWPSDLRICRLSVSSFVRLTS